MQPAVGSRRTGGRCWLNRRARSEANVNSGLEFPKTRARIRRSLLNPQHRRWVVLPSEEDRRTPQA